MLYHSEPRLNCPGIYRILIFIVFLFPLFGYAQKSAFANYSVASGNGLFATGKWAIMINRTEADPEVRHEHGYVEANGKFYLIGGRGGKSLNIFDPVSRTWSVGADLPGGTEIHHFQAVNFRDKIYVIGAFTGGFPNETPLGNIYIYDPVTDTWADSVNSIPLNRRRAAAGTVVYNNKIYLVGGIVNGHKSGWVNWMDEYDPLTGKWKIMPDAPHERDHFHAVVIQNKLYATGGRKTGFTSLLGDTDPTIDVYDFAAGEWNTLPESSNLPLPRAGAAGIAVDGKIILIGGESNESPAHHEVDAFDPVTGKWTSLSPLLSGRHGIQAVLSDERIYVASGMGFNGSTTEELNTQEFYDIVSRPLSKAPVVQDPVKNQKTFINSKVWTVDVSGTFSDDLDSGFLTLTVTRNTNPALIPNITITGNQIRLSIADSITGNSVIRIRATDSDQLFAEDEFVLSVTPIGPRVVEPVSDQRLKVNGKPAEIDLQSVFTDDKGSENLTFTVSLNTNSKLIIPEISGNNKLVLHTQINQTGVSRIRVRATDADRMIAEDDFLVTVNTNPFKAPYVITPVYDRSVKMNSDSLVLPLTGVFSDDRPISELTYSIDRNSNPALFKTVINEAGNLVVIPEKNKSGTGLIRVTGTDRDGLTGTEEFKIEIVPPVPSPGSVTFINAGTIHIQQGRSWITDTGYVGGQIYGSTDSILNTDDQLLYQTERWGENFGYEIPLYNGEYKVILHFAEIYWQDTGKRVFNVNVENEQGLLNNFDIVKEAGGSHRAVKKAFNKIRVADGKLSIGLQSVSDNAKISGIEIVTLSVDPINDPPFVQLPLPDRIMAFSTDSILINIYKVFSDDQGAVLLNLSLDEVTDTGLVKSGVLSGQLLKLTFRENTTGSAVVRLKATDKEGLTATEEFRVTIYEPPASAPLLTDTIPDQIVKFNAAPATLPMKQFFTDNRGFENLKISIVTNSHPSVLVTSIQKDSLLHLTYKRNVSGTSLIRVRATDVDGLIAEDSFYVTIQEKEKQDFSLRINCGGPEIINDGTLWVADSLYAGGYKYINPDMESGNPAFNLYRTERYGNHTYEIPVPEGEYIVRLHFAEIYWSQPGRRLFNANIEQGQGKLANYDIFERAGGSGKVIIEEFKSVFVEDGSLSIRFEGVSDQAKISAIEILSAEGNQLRKMNSSFRDVPPVGETMPFSVYPNPNVTGLLNIRIPGLVSDETMQVNVIDINGKTVYSRTQVNSLKGRMTIQLPSTVSKGSYFIIISNKSQRFTSRIIYQ